jgi:hypothetical protein
VKGAMEDLAESLSPIEPVAKLTREAELMSISSGDLQSMAIFLNAAVEKQISFLTTLSDQHERKESSKQFVQHLANLTDKMLVNPIIWHTMDDKSRGSTATNVQNGVEDAAMELSKQLDIGESVTINNPRLEIRSSKVDPNNRDDLTFQYNDSSITLPGEWIEDNTKRNRIEPIEVSFFGYDDLHDILDTDGLGKHYQINSKILGAKVNFDYSSKKSSRKKRSDGPSIFFNNLRPINAKASTVHCAFWDTDDHRWSTRGCKTENIQDTSVHCICDHLTNFAVLMDVHSSLDKGQSAILVWITTPGCIISIVCLLITAAIFAGVRTLSGETATIHKNLCLSLAAAQTLLLTGLDSTFNRTLCTVIAASLHYLFLVSFVWMLIEGVQIYVMVTQVKSI